MTAKLKLVPPPEKRKRKRKQRPAIDIAAQWREEVRQRDWGAVHIAGDRSPPVSLARRIWAYTMPTSRKGR